MVSFSHEFLVELFRTRGELAPALLRRIAEIAFDHDRVEHGSIDLALLRAKLDMVTADDEAAIEAVGDERRLIELIGALGLATATADVRAALAALRAAMEPR